LRIGVYEHAYERVSVSGTKEIWYYDKWHLPLVKI
jgi:hypothetical protein